MIKVETGSDLIARYDNVIPESICERIVNYVTDNIPENKIKQGDLPWLNNDNIPFVNIKDVEIKKLIDGYRFLLTQLVFDHYKQIVFPHFTDLVLWREGMKMSFHKDNGYEGKNEEQFRPRTYSMVVYLNHDYEGGETIIKINNTSEYISTPKQGSIVIFKSNEECIHGVNEVTEGTRITLPIWFATEIKECETMLGKINDRLVRL